MSPHAPRDADHDRDAYVEVLIAAGWEVKDGQRVRRVAPLELDLPLLETFRALRGVGADLTFFPTADGCGTPTLILPPRGG